MNFPLRAFSGLILAFSLGKEASLFAESMYTLERVHGHLREFLPHQEEKINSDMVQHTGGAMFPSVALFVARREDHHKTTTTSTGTTTTATTATAAQPEDRLIEIRLEENVNGELMEEDDVDEDDDEEENSPPKHLRLKFRDLPVWEDSQVKTRESQGASVSNIDRRRFFFDPIELHRLAQSYAYPGSNGLTQTDREYFNMIRTENGFSDFKIVKKDPETKESNKKSNDPKSKPKLVYHRRRESTSSARGIASVSYPLGLK